MRIGVIHWAFLPFIGGVESHLATIYPEIAKMGNKVYLLTGSYKGSPSYEKFQGVDVIRVDGLVPDKINKLNRAEAYKKAYKIFLDFIKKTGIDIVHAHNFHLNFFDYSRALVDVCKERGIPVFLILHNDYFKLNEPAITKRIVGQIRWDRLVCISKYLKDVTLKEHKKISKKKCLVVPHGIDIKTFRKISVAEKTKMKKGLGLQKKRVIFLPTKIIPKKGTIEAVRAMYFVKKKVPEAVLLYKKTGRYITSKKTTDQYIEKVKKEIKKLGLVKNVFAVEQYLSVDKLAKYYAIADIVINPSVYIDEPFGLVPVEGMSCGTPVIVTRSGGLVESVVDGVTGYIISKNPKRIPRELAKKAVELLKNPLKSQRMGIKGRERVRKLYDKKRMAKDFIIISKAAISKVALKDRYN